ncbi:XkdF-like putative serine protease domain-containing protein [Sphingobacterium multivorum]|uniref:XkdF-like putative serine protease domain-containing protein n=1 Tax=Sphingobacterium multivorum TaxID=28454 RepID=UPI0028A6E4A5|nr:XkdF-like putative serine protease domain-containing protein [Sphingobacterium multivorum]
MDRKLYELKINPSIGMDVNVISIVDSPAVESSFLAFSKQEKKETFAVANDDRMELIGVAMIPDKIIPRFDGVTKEEYDVFFSKDTIRTIAQNYFYSGYQHSINLQHSDTFVNAHVWQSYIVDSAMGLNAPKGIEAIDGTWVVGVQLDKSDTGAQKLWKFIKDGTYTGFSVEGYFINQLTQNFNSQITLEQEIDNALQALNTKK